jgi:predicted ATPase
MAYIKGIRIVHDRYPTRDRYPFNLPVLGGTSTLTFPSQVTFFAGENGSGKSTLLRAICRSGGIHIWEEERRRRLKPNPFEKRFHEAVDIDWVNGPAPGSFFSSEIFTSYAQAVEEFAAADPGSLRFYGGSSLVTQSHGQSLMSFFRARSSFKGLFLMDEPETALSPRTQIEFLRLLAQAGREGGAQFIIASHSPILLACPGAMIYSFDGRTIKAVDYEDTEYYRVYRDFLNHRGGYLEGL